VVDFAVNDNDVHEGHYKNIPENNESAIAVNWHSTICLLISI
jgi:hypothetical protein